MNRLSVSIATTAFMLVAAPGVGRAEKAELRIATLAPAGSPWMQVLDKGAAEIKTKTAGRVTMKYFEGGQQGDEKDFVRKIKLGQLDGAAVTAVGLAMIDESIRVLELPMLFQTSEEVDYVADKMWPYFQKKFEKKGFKLNDRGEVGWIHLFSKAKVETIADLKGQKLWQWSDDKLSGAIIKKLGLRGVPLGVPEVDASLTGGKINACFTSPVAAVALQWYSKVKYISSAPLTFAIAATVLSMDSLKKLSAQDQKTVEGISKASSQKLRKVIRKANKDAKSTMIRKGITVVQTPAATVDQLASAAQEVWKELAGSVYSKEELEMALKYRDEYRAKRKK